MFPGGNDPAFLRGVALFLFVAAVPCALGQEDADCLLCHGDPGATKQMPDGTTVSMYVDEKTYGNSVHQGIGCIACHADISELPHPETLKAVDCGTCHDESQVYAQSAHGRARSAGDMDVATCVDCHGKHAMLPAKDPLSPVSKRNMPQTCGKCHSDATLVKKHLVSVSKPSEAYLRSAHAKAIASGNEEAAVCTDCHGSHDIQPSQHPASLVARANIQTTCGKCHADKLADFERSIHAKALAAGIRDAPTCVDCHGEHDIEPPQYETSRVAARAVSRSTCPRCHEDETTMTKYGIATHRQASYMDSYHGITSRSGGKVVASCASCHRAHAILPRDDPASTIHTANLVATCGQCHEGATANFAASPVHIVPTDPSQRAIGIVRLVYVWLIVLLIGGMILHNSLLMLRHMAAKFHAELRGPNTHRRFSPGQIVGHFVLMVTFTVLAISGFALRFPDNYWLKLVFFNGASIELRSTIHRWAGAALIALLIAHLLHGAFSRHGRKEALSLLPRLRDARDLLANLRYAIGLSGTQPKYDRYSYSEKLEYWGMMWGSVLMGVTGVCMWFAEDFMRLFSKVFLDVAAAIHYYEAWLAVGTILVWHMYYMILDPQTYPMNWSWITGRITEEDFKERHALEYERELRATRLTPPDEPKPASEPILASTIIDWDQKK